MAELAESVQLSLRFYTLRAKVLIYHLRLAFERCLCGRTVIASPENFNAALENHSLGERARNSDMSPLRVSIFSKVRCLVQVIPLAFEI